MTDKILAEVRARIKQRGGNAALGRRTATEQVIRELHTLETVGQPLADQAFAAAAAVRVEASQKDHLEAQLAAYAAAQRGESLNVGETIRPSLSELPAASPDEAWDEAANSDGGVGDNVIPFAAAWSHLREIADHADAADQGW